MDSSHLALSFSLFNEIAKIDQLSRTAMDIAFTSSSGLSVFDIGGGAVDDAYPTTGPFALKMTTK